MGTIVNWPAPDGKARPAAQPLFDWAPEPAPAVPDSPLAELMREVDRELGSDGSLVAWRRREDATLPLFQDGLCQPGSTVEQAMLTAVEAVRLGDDLRPVRWTALDGGDGSDALLTLAVPVDDGVVLVSALLMHCSINGQTAARETATRLLPLVRAFFTLWVQHAAATSRSRSLTAAIDSSDVATVLVNRNGRVLVVNAGAEAMIAEQDGLRRAGIMLAGGRLADTMRLQAAIEHVANSGDGAAAPAPVIALQRRSRRPLLATIIGADAGSRSDDEAAAIVHVFDPEGDLALRLAPVCRLYGLSPVESRLATQIAGGATLAAAAAAMRVQEQTARSYLKQVFLKTDTRRQAQLVWLLLASAVRVAPTCRPQFI